MFDFLDNIDEYSAMKGLWVYWKDNRGNYLGCNNTMADVLGLASSKDIIGRSVFDIDAYNPKEAKIYQQQDSAVMNSLSPLIFNDSASLPSHKIDFLVFKTPIFNNATHKIDGILGFSYYQSEIFTDNKINLNLLSKRELECFPYLTKGFTSKQIGKLMGISSRTVDSYIDSIKIKLNCDSRQSLRWLVANLNIN